VIRDVNHVAHPVVLHDGSLSSARRMSRVALDAGTVAMRHEWATL
jgi:hypothetical protein